MSEALVIGFAMLVAKDLSDVDPNVLFSVGGTAAVLCLLVAGSLRHRWGYVAGSLLQLMVIAAGFVVPVMFALGAIFAALWVLSIYLGRRVERIQAAQAARPDGQQEGMVTTRDDPGRS
jgi:hypothetical protein